MQLDLVGPDLGLGLVVAGLRGRLGAGQLLPGLGQLGLVLADLLASWLHAALDAPAPAQSLLCLAWSALRVDWSVLTFAWSAAIAWLAGGRRVRFGLLVRGQGLLVLGHGLLLPGRPARRLAPDGAAMVYEPS